MTFATIAAVFFAPAGEWEQLRPLPDAEGFAGAYAGVSGGALLVAGGANFPDKKPWEGGKKVWYDRVFVLDSPGAEWKVAGKLPGPRGYGVSVGHGGGVVCIGGGDAGRHYADTFRLVWKGGRLVTTLLPPLPTPLANASGAVVGDTLYVAGGQARPDAAETVKAAWKLDLAGGDPQWAPLEPWPGAGRMLAAAAGHGGAFYLAGGVDLVPGADGKSERRYLKDAYRYDPARGWERIADLPHPLAAAPSPAPADAAGFFVLGGDDGSQSLVPPDKHRGFGKTILRYGAVEKKWAAAGDLAAPRVTTACVVWGKFWVVPSGEVRPGVRSPGVWAFSQRNQE